LSVQILQTSLQELQQLIDDNQRFLICSHVSPDGDAVGSSLAMKRMLEKLGKDAVWVMEEQPPDMFDSFYDPKELVIFDKKTDTYDDFDVMVILDAAVWKRLGEPGLMMEQHEGKKLCVDHHHTDYEFPGVKISDVESPSTTLLIHRIIKYLDVSFTHDLAEPVYLGLMMDTQNFHLPNTTVEAHHIAAECLQAGVKPNDVYKPVFGTLSFTRVRLMSMALDTIVLLCGGKVAVMHISLDMFKESGAKTSEDEGFSDMVRMLEGVDIGIYVREVEAGKVKVSWRANGDNNVEASARHFGGGGHLRAAGALFRTTLQEAKEKVISNIIERYEKGEII